MFRRRNRRQTRPQLSPKDRDILQSLQRILEPIGYRVTAFAAPGPPLETVKTGVGSAIAGLPREYLWLGLGGLLLLAARAWARKRRGRYVRNVMVSDVEAIESSATIVEAAQRMRDTNVGVLPIVEGGRIRGIVTDRDLVVRGLARGIDASSILVGQCATTQAVTVKADWSVDDALALMAEHQVGRLPVIDDENRVIGMVTLSSLARRARDQGQVLDTAKELSERSARAS
jgi:CBS domain-containing protein